MNGHMGTPTKSSFPHFAPLALLTLSLCVGSPTQNRVFQEATKLGFEVYSFDQCGHGRSATDATRGHLASWLTLVQDQLDFFLHVLHTNPAARTRTFFVGGSHILPNRIPHASSLTRRLIDGRARDDARGAPPLHACVHRRGRSGCDTHVGAALVPRARCRQAPHVRLHVSTSSALAHPPCSLAAWTRAHFGGAVLAAPAFEPIAQPNAVLHGLLNLLHLLGASSLALGPSPRVEQFVSPESFAAYKSDKYSYSGPMRLSLAHNVLALAQVLLSRCSLRSLSHLRARPRGSSCLQWPSHS